MASSSDEDITTTNGGGGGGPFSQVISSIRRRSFPLVNNVGSSSTSNTTVCHECSVPLGMRKFKHRCKNCGKYVCNKHSRNSLPLPHFGVFKEVRVCDTCAKQVVKRRAGYKSPRRDKLCKSSPSFEDSGTSNSNNTSSEIDGILLEKSVEVQDNTIDEVLFLGTMKMGSRSLASRHLNPKLALWKDRTLLLTYAEIMLCKKMDKEASIVVKSSVHMTDILYAEIHETLTKVITILHCDGKFFRLRVSTPEDALVVFKAIEKTRGVFQQAMQSLTLDGHASSMAEKIVVSFVTISCISHGEMVLDTSYRARPTGVVVDFFTRTDAVLSIYLRGPRECDDYVASIDLEELCQMVSPFENVISVSTSALRKSNNSRASEDDSHNNNVTFSISLKVTKAKSQDYKTSTIVAVVVGIIICAASMMEIRSTVLVLVILVLLAYNNDLLAIKICNYKVCYPKSVTLDVVGISIADPEEKSNDDENSSEGSSSLQDEEFLDSDIDIRYIEGCRGDMVDARFRYKRTMNWRADNNIDSILTTAQPHFTTMKKCLVQYIHKTDKMGHFVAYADAGMMKKAIADFTAAGVSREEAIIHQVFCTEYCWRVADTRPYPHSCQLSVLDLTGIGFSDIGGDVVSFMKSVGAAIGDNNPERLYKVFIINPPSWFNLLWKVVSPLINPKTRDKTHVVRGKAEITKELLKYIDAENLPEAYGGKCNCEGGTCKTSSKFEVELAAFVEFINNPHSTLEEREAEVERLQNLYAERHESIGNSNGATLSSSSSSENFSPSRR